jgi:MYXO-CTERM domain-containing protein
MNTRQLLCSTSACLALLASGAQATTLTFEGAGPLGLGSGAGYGSLSFALGHGAFNVKGYIELTPDAGWDVVLNNVDIAGWSAGSYADSRIRVEDSAGTVYFDSGVFTFPASTTFTGYLGAPIRSSLPLRLYVEDFGDLGIDNLQFSQVASIPEPGTWALWLAGVGVLGTLARRRTAR